MTMSQTTLEGDWLLLDASLPQPWVGLLRGGQWAAFCQTQSGALESLATAAQECLAGNGTGLEELAGFIFCEGPGSLLSLRVAAMMLRTWLSPALLGNKPLYGYRSLELAARMVHNDTGATAFSVIAPARRKLWWHQPYQDGALPEAAEVPYTTIETLEVPLYYLAQRKAWQEPPPGAVEMQYALENHAGVFATPGLLHPLREPEVFPAAAPEYARWDAQRHR